MNLHTQFLNNPEDIQWLRETHLKNFGEKDKVKSFILAGNEDYPTWIEVFETAEPLHTDRPLARLLPDSDRGWDIPHRA